MTELRDAGAAISREGGTISGQKKYFLEANGRQLALQEGDIIVGRSRNCNLVLKDPSASRNHALLIVHPDGVRLKDLNSTNGTYVNNQRLTEDLPLRPGDRISIGQTEMVFGATEDALSSAAEVPAAVKPAAGRRQEETSDDRVPTALAPTAGTGQGHESAAVGAAESARPQRSITTSVLPRDSSEVEAARQAHAAGDVVGDETLGPRDPHANPGPPSHSPPAPEAANPPEASDEISVLDALESEPLPPLPEPEPAPEFEAALQAEPPRPKPPAPPAAATPRLQTADDSALAASSGETSDSGETVPTDKDGTKGELLPSLDLDAFEQALQDGPPPPAASSTSADPAAAAPPAASVTSTGGYRADSMVFSSGKHRPKTGPRLEPAGFGIRLVAGLVDSILLAALGFGVFFAVGGPESPGASTLSGLATSAGSLLMLLFGWTLWGTTPGKRLFKLYVREEDGAELSAGKAVLRLFGYLVSTLALGLGFLMIAFTKGKRGLHDVIAGTYVGRA